VLVAALMGTEGPAIRFVGPAPLAASLRRAVSYSVTAERGRCGEVVVVVMSVMCAALAPRTAKPPTVVNTNYTAHIMGMNAPSRPTEAQLAELYAWRSVALDLMPYMAAQLFALTPLNDPGVHTFAVDHRHRLYINFDNAIPYGPRFCGEALLHECSHLFGAHYDRANDAGITLEQYKSWGLCADFEINDDLRDAGCSRLAAHGVFAEKIGEDDYQTVEHYWAVLQRMAQQQKQQGQGGSGEGQGTPQQGEGEGDGESEPYSGCGSGSGGEPAPSELPEGEDVGGYARAATDAEVTRTRIATAATIRDYAASGRGTVPAGLTELADIILAPPKVPWKAVVASVIRRALARRAGDTDTTYTRRNRRRHNVVMRSTTSGGTATGTVSRIVYPGTYSPDPFIALVRDTSGSMGSAELNDAANEIEGIARQCGVRGRQLRVLDVDAAVHEVRNYSGADSIAEVTGRGGTDMATGIEAALELKPRPDLVIVVSDGYTPWPVEAHRVPLVICLVGAAAERVREHTPDWATTVVVERD